MSTKPNNRARLAGVVSLVVFSTLVILSTFACQDRTKSALTKSRSEIGSEMTRLTQQHRYDEAVNLGSSGLSGESEDAVLYRSIAVVYTVRAQNDPKNRERWLQSAVEFVDKSLEARPGDPFNTSAVAEGLEAIGDLSDDRKCRLYGRAESLWHLAATQTLDKPMVTEGGQAISTAPIKQAAESRILLIASKRKGKNCP